MPSELEDFHSRFQAEIRDRAAGDGRLEPDFAPNVFTDYVIELLSAEIGVIEGAESVYFEGPVGRGQGQLNGYGLSDDEAEQDAIDLFVSVYYGGAGVAQAPAEQLKQASERAVRAFSAALAGIHQKFDPSSDRYAMCERIHAAARRIKRARLFVLTDGLTELARRGPRITRPGDGALEVQIEFWDIERMARAFSYGQPQQEIEIDIEALNGEPLPCISAEEGGGEFEVLMTILPGELLRAMYDLYGARLLERNVRSFLQAKGKVNAGIRRTLREEPGRFLAYNNGISITADEIVADRRNDSVLYLKAVHGLQIVNGGQTTASIHRAARTDKVDLADVGVQAKITVLRSDIVDTIAPRIAEFANSQNPVQMADFSANDPFHIELERLASAIWIPPDHTGQWFYERARGQYQTAMAKEGTTDARRRAFKLRTPPKRKLTKLDVARVLNAWDQLPHIVCLGGQKNFVRFTQKMRERRTLNWRPDDVFFRELVAKYLVFSTVTRSCRQQFDGYRSQIATYTISALSVLSAEQFDFELVWSNQDSSPELEALVADWTRLIASQLIESAGGRNVSEWCKKVDCWRRMQTLQLEWPDTLPPELSRVRTASGDEDFVQRESIDPDELDARRRCRELSAADWVRIVDWANDTGSFEPASRRLASELAVEAANGWLNEIPARKALLGRALINSAIEKGVFETETASATAVRE